MFFLHCMLNICRYEKNILWNWCVDCFIAQSIKWCDILGVHSESIFRFIQYFFLSRKLCFLWSTCPLFIAEPISLDTSGEPTEGFSWKLLFPFERYCQSHLMNLIRVIDYWRADDEFSCNNFYFIVVKEILYGKKY